MTQQEKLTQLEKERDEINQKLLNPQELTEQDRSTLYSDLEYYNEIIFTLTQIKKLKEELRDTKSLIKDESTDSELLAVAQTEIDSLKEKIDLAQQKYQQIEVERKYVDPDDKRSAIIEIRAGAGGDEAGLFAGDLLRMYQLFADKMGWAVEIISTSINEAGGYREVVANIQGKDVFKLLKYESGVHRVQRIPSTESKGRIHTSTASVAILPEAKEIDVEIKPEDIKVEVMRATGAGGQCVNTTDSAVRITHLPTGLVVSCQETKHQLQNREKAMAMLRARLYEQKKQEQIDKRDAMRASQVGKMMRAEKIRTYNYPQNRVTDHRIKVSWHNLENILGGDLHDVLTETKAEIIKQLIEQDDSN